MKKNKLKSILKVIVITGFVFLLGMTCYSFLPKEESISKAENKSDSINGWKSAEAEKDHVYCVGSVSKIYSTAAVMKLVDDGKVKLDNPITEYISDFTMADKRYKDITVRMLMNHTSGIMGTSVKSSALYEDNNSYHHDNLLKELAGQRLKVDPGKYAAYCNDGFDLLAIITERVSGISFSDFVKKCLVSPTGGSSTGTGLEYKKLNDISPAYSSNHDRFDQGVTLCLGAGGVYATAADTARFGAGFFDGNKKMLSEGSKNAMATRWNNSDKYMDECGLGWDSVTMKSVKNVSLKVLGKGGDSGMNHSYLMVAPKNKISISVQTNGGSSALNGLIAERILRIMLEEKGIDVPEETVSKHEIEKDIPASFDKYAGSYLVATETGEIISRISFPDHTYMHVENITPIKTYYTDYALCDDGNFYELAYEVNDSGVDDMKLAINANSFSFVDGADGKTYIAGERVVQFPEIGSYTSKSYFGEMLKDNPVSKDSTKTWESFDGASAVLCDDFYSSQNYNVAVAKIIIPKEYPGYVFVMSAMGTRLLKITDPAQAVAFQTIPSSKNRDLVDMSIFMEDDSMKVRLSNGSVYQVVNSIPEFDNSMKEIVTKTGKARWYRISEDKIYSDVTIKNRPKDSAVYVYNKFGEVVYTSHVKDITNTLPMPRGGMILFLGKDGGKITL